MSEAIYDYRPGRVPLLVSLPHVGTEVPAPIADRLTPAAASLPDTDWHVDRLYDFLDELGAHVLCARMSRYVVDLNRAPDSRALYPGANNTELCPTTSFADAPLYREGAAPDDDEIAERSARYWQPYHERIAASLAAIQAEHGVAVLWDAHSIRSRVPRFFDGRLPDLNLGTGGGATASDDLVARLGEICRASGYSSVVDGRFKGGYITRNYGRPAAGVQALQLELAQVAYMDEDPPYRFDEARAATLRPVLRRLLEACLDWVGEGPPPAK
jgi:N-formylglutamate deformylase